MHELWFLHSAHPLMYIDIYMKFHEDRLNSFQVIERTRFCDRQTDVLGKNNTSPYPKGWRHNKTFPLYPYLLQG